LPCAFQNRDQQGCWSRDYRDVFTACFERHRAKVSIHQTKISLVAALCRDDRYVEGQQERRLKIYHTNKCDYSAIKALRDSSVCGPIRRCSKTPSLSIINVSGRTDTGFRDQSALGSDCRDENSIPNFST